MLKIYKINSSIKRQIISLATILGLISILLLIPSCQTLEGISLPNYQYQLGLGYGFLDKQVQVSVDGVPVLFVVGNEKMEDFAQLQGTNMLYSGTSKRGQITVSVSVDGNLPVDQIITLDDGPYIHIYLDNAGLSIYNTSELIFE
jgi:hypothetical protein